MNQVKVCKQIYDNNGRAKSVFFSLNIEEYIINLGLEYVSISLTFYSNKKSKVNYDFGLVVPCVQTPLKKQLYDPCLY